MPPHSKCTPLYLTSLCPPPTPPPHTHAPAPPAPAPQELAAYRKAQAEEALKMSVLDAEAAAKFSTAAALDARDKLAIPAAGASAYACLVCAVAVCAVAAGG